MNMTHLRWAGGARVGCVLALAALGCGSASAFYQTPAVPSGFSGSAAAWFYSRAATDTVRGSVISTTAVLNAGGVAVKLPFAMRVASTAGRVAAAAAFGWPGVFLAAGVAAYGYYQSEGYQARSDGWYKSRTLPGAYQMTSTFGHACTGTVLSEVMNCSVAGLTVQGDWVVGVGYQQLPVHWQGGSCQTQSVMVEWQSVGNFVASELRCTVIGQPETIYDKLTRQQFEDGLAARPVPETLPEVWPATVPITWPVEVPVLNPSPTGVPQPLSVPTGDPVAIPLPVPNPNNEPQRWRQPVTEIVPSPTLDDPWRVDVRPKDYILDSPAPWSPSAPPVPVSPPTSAAEQPLTDCDKLPSSVGCSPMGTVSDPAMPPVPVLYTPVYPDGLSGVWQAKKAELTATPLMGTVSSLMPAGFGGGTCPHWQLPLDIGPWSYGSYDVAPPCWLWDVAKAIVIISALMLARSLIFGG